MNLDPKTAAAVAGYLPKALETAKKVFKQAGMALDYSVRDAHINYACSIIKKYSRAKTFFIRREPVDLYDFYVPSSIEYKGDKKIEKVDLNKVMAISPKVIITGSGGSGKTILMRHLLLDTLLSANRFPILVELRNLNDDDTRTLEQEINEILKQNDFSLGSEYVNRSLEDGLFVLLLDGFDELQFSRRKSVEREVKQFASLKNCQIIITSRVDVSLQSWNEFTNTKISDLTLDEACDLVEKISFDIDIKTRFVEDLRSGLFESHKFFLSNPLMLSIMLLTYGDSANIPKRQSSFYMQAYETLFQQHDALKSGFKRDRKTKLDVYEFAKIFSAFSVLSYDSRAFRFTLSDAIKFAKKAVEISGTSGVSCEGFVEDSKQAVCLLIEDGLELSFAHRSFQEFFAAKFIAESEDGLQKKLVEKYGKKRRSIGRVDNVLDLLYEMAPLVVERYFLIPALSAFFGESETRRVSKKFWLGAFKSCFENIKQDLGDEHFWFLVKDNGNPTYELLAFVHKVCLDNAAVQESRVRWKREREAFMEKHFQSKPFLILTKNIDTNSSIADDLSKVHAYLSIEGLEQIRILLRDMRKRASARTTALDKVFSLK